MGDSKTLMYVSIVMNVINVVGNFIGIFVLHAGVEGVAYPSLISRIFAAVVMLCLTARPTNIIVLRMKNVMRFDSGMIQKIFTIALPNSIENGLFQIAANGVAQSFWSMAALSRYCYCSCMI